MQSCDAKWEKVRPNDPNSQFLSNASFLVNDAMRQMTSTSNMPSSKLVV